MRNEIRGLFLACVGLLAPTIVSAQSVDILAQNVDIEFESYGACPLYLVPGTDDYDLCREQARQYDWTRKRPRSVGYIEEIDTDYVPVKEERNNRFNIREHYQ